MIKRIKHKVTTSAPARKMIHQSRRTFLPGFGGIALYDVIQFFIGQVRTIGMTERASAISFNLVMAIPPAFIFLFTLIPLLPISAGFQQSLFDLIREIVPGEKNHANLIHFLEDFINRPRNELLSLGFVLSMFFSSNAMMGIQRSFNKNYLGFKKRKGWQKRLSALRITLVMYILVSISVLLLMAQGQLLQLIVANETLRTIIINARWVIIALLFFACISYIYRHAPAVHEKWRLVNPGSVLATLLMLCTTFLFSWWVGQFGQYNQLFGSIGTVLILMALVFINSLVLLIGFELNVSITSLKEISNRPNMEPPPEGTEQTKSA